jgi:hypothetical protein
MIVNYDFSNIFSFLSLSLNIPDFWIGILLTMIALFIWVKLPSEAKAVIIGIFAAMGFGFLLGGIFGGKKN